MGFFDKIIKRDHDDIKWFPISGCEHGLVEILKKNRMDPSEIKVPVVTDERNRPQMLPDRGVIVVIQAKKNAEYRVSQIRELFRGDKKPPSEDLMERYPREYVPYFAHIEFHAMQYCDIAGDVTDREFLDVFSVLRRIPDGRSTGPLHDHLWQACALLLALSPISRDQFEAIIGRLARSVRTFQTGYGSKNYIANLRNEFGNPAESDDLDDPSDIVDDDNDDNDDDDDGEEEVNEEGESDYEPDRRIAAILGAPDLYDLPTVGMETLTVYYRHLKQNMSLPFEATCTREKRPFEDETFGLVVLDLVDIGETPGDGFLGVLCYAMRGKKKIVIPLAEVDVPKGGVNKQLVDDYGEWFWNNR